MPQTSANLDLLRSIILLLAAVIGLVTLVLNILHGKLKGAETEERKRELYYNFLGWFGTALWIAGASVSIAFGPSFGFFIWLAAFALESVLFLTSKSPRLRAEIFRLIISAQGVIAMGFASLLEDLTSLIRSMIGL